MHRHFLVVALICLVSALPARGQESDPANWQSDVDVLLDTMRQVHPDLYHAHSREEWGQAATRFKKRLPRLSYAEAALGFSRLVALAEDGHSQLRSAFAKPFGPGFRTFYPVDLSLFSDGLRVRKVAAEHTELFGSRIRRINGVPSSEILDRLRPYISTGNKMLVAYALPLYLQFPAVLRGTGLSDSLRAPLVLTVAEGKGESKTVSIDAVSRDSPPEMIHADKFGKQEKELPLYRRLASNYAFEYLQDEQLLYFRFRNIQNKEEEPIAAFVERLFSFVESHTVTKFVVDLRDNTGGNNYLVQPLLHGLISHKKINRPGHLFVITDRGTFSAAADLAARIERHTHALFVGEPTGAPPNAFGNDGGRDVITLPASGLKVAVANVYWQNSLPLDDRPWIYPDIPVRLSYDEYTGGYDPAMEVIKGYSPDQAPEWLNGLPYRSWKRPTQQLDWEIVVEQ